jgi:2-keto-4-pentenoate hydratase/2-oxohepta-3-ene-1,7-dioic acid hydratase in catechol pathway
VFLGRRIRHVSEAEAEASVGAIVAVNDVTARDLQRSDGQWTRAKSFDTFCPIGEPSTSFGSLRELELVARVNGEEKQRATSDQMVFSIPFLLAFISQVMTLNEGDLVLTGTPAGVGPLKAGDVVEIEVTGVSRLSNPVVEEG